MSGKTIAALTVTAAAVGVGIWWLRRKDTTTAQTAVIQAAQQVQQQVQKIAAAETQANTGAGHF